MRDIKLIVKIKKRPNNYEKPFEYFSRLENAHSDKIKNNSVIFILANIKHF